MFPSADTLNPSLATRVTCLPQERHESPCVPRPLEPHPHRQATCPLACTCSTTLRQLQFTRTHKCRWLQSCQLCRLSCSPGNPALSYWQHPACREVPLSDIVLLMLKAPHARLARPAMSVVPAVHEWYSISRLMLGVQRQMQLPACHDAAVVQTLPQQLMYQGPCA